MPNPEPRSSASSPPTDAHPEPVPLLSPSDLVNPMLTVADAMTASPRTCSPHSMVLEAVLIFRDADCGIIPVTEDGKPLGVLTDRDVALALAEHENDLASLPVSAIMVHDVVTIGADETLDKAVDRLGREGLRRLLVVGGDGTLKGILSWVDLVPHVSERGLGHVAAQVARHH